MRAYEIISKEQLNEIDLKKLKTAAAAGIIGGALALTPVAMKQDTVIPQPTSSTAMAEPASDAEEFIKATPSNQTVTLSTELASLPVDQKKQLFFDTIAPLVKQANANILKQRERILSSNSKDGPWLVGMFKTYGADNVDDLLKKVDIIPVSLAVAQAAIESGWGTSRFAQQGNALFGQRDYSGGGIKPTGASGFTVAKFGSLADSIKSYMLNLNKHAAYNNFRTKRETLRQANKPLNSLSLVTGLSKYSERGQDYINDIMSVIKFNKLQRYDKL